MGPRSLAAPPENAFWIDVTVIGLKTVVEQFMTARARLMTPDERTAADAMLSVWYARPGTEAREAIPIDPERELLGTPYTAGTYYARTLGAPPKGGEGSGEDPARLLEGARYYKAEALQPVAPRPIETQMVHGRALDTEVAYSAHLAQRLDKALSEAERNRSALHDAEDKNRELEREVQQLTAELEAAQANDAPLFGDEIMGKLMEQLTVYLQLPSGGTSQQYLAELFDAFWVFVHELYQDAPLLQRLIKRQPEAWDKISFVFNTIAERKLNESRIPQSEEIMRVLANAKVVREAEELRAAQKFLKKGGFAPRPKSANRPGLAARRPSVGALASGSARASKGKAKPAQTTKTRR